MSRRKNRGVILLASALSLGLIGGLVSCNDDQTHEDDNDPWKNFVEDDSITGLEVTNIADLQATWKAGEADRTMSFKVTPDANITSLIQAKKIMAVSSDTTVVNVLGNKLQALKGGEATITVRAGKQKVEFKITVTAVKDYKPGDEETLANIIELPASSSMYYKTEGVILSWQSGSDGTKYGNFYVATEWNKEASNILVYGATGLAKDATSGETTVVSEKDGTYSFNNPKDWLTNETTKDLKIGDKISFYCMRTDYNSTKELYAWNVSFVEHKDFPATPEPATVAVTSLSEVLEPEAGSVSDTKYTGKAKISKITYSEYGNISLTDLDGENEVDSYGSTNTASAITWDGVTEKYGYKNPKDFLTNEVTKDLVIGSVVEFEMIRADYKGAIQVFTVIKSAIPVAPTAVAISGDTEVTKGETIQLSYATTPEKVSPSTLAGLTWASENDAVATVDQTGLVTGVAAGTAKITVTISETVKAEYSVTVSEIIAPTAISISSTETTVEAGKTITFTATTTPEIINVPLTWESSDTAVATVNEEGVVTGVAAGTAKITAKYGTVVSDEVEITVTAAAVETVKSSYDFTANTKTDVFSDGDTATMKTYLSSCLVSGGSDIISEVTAVNKAYYGYSGYQTLGLKFGTSSADGTLGFKINDSSVTKMKIKGIGWKTSDKINVGDKSYTSSAAYTTNTLEDYEFAVSSANEITITLNRRFFIASISFIG